MDRIWRLIAMLMVAVVLTACGEGGLYGGAVVTQGSHTLPAGQSVLGDLLVVGGEVQLATGSRIEGSVYALGGDVDAAGTIAGDLLVLGGRVRLEPGSTVRNDVAVVGGELDRSPDATVLGAVTTQADDVLPSLGAGASQGPSLLDRALWAGSSAVILAALAILLIHVLPRPLERVMDAAVDHALVSGAMGLLALIVIPSLLMFMVFTLVLIPVAIAGALLLGASMLYGFTGMSLRIGPWLARRRGWRPRPAATAIVGAVVLSVVLQGITLLPILGIAIGVVLASVALGAVLLTGFGLRAFVPRTLEPPSRMPDRAQPSVR